MGFQRIIFFCSLQLVIVLNIQAQNRRMHSSSRSAFDSIRTERWKEFNKERTAALRDYAAAVRQAWQEFKGEPAIEKPEEELVLPVLVDENGVETESVWDNLKGLFKKKGRKEPRRSKLKPIEGNGEVLEVGKVLPLAISPTRARPLFQIAEVPRQVQLPNAYRTITLFGLACKIRIGENCRIKIEDLTPDHVADVMKSFEQPQFDNMLYDCLKVKRQYRLSDWAYYLMLQKLVDGFYGKDTNEASLALSFLYSQSGYKMRLGRVDSHLVMLAACHHTIHGKDFTFADYPDTQTRYYLLDGRRLGSTVHISNAKWPKESSMSLQLTAEQEFALSKTPQRTIRSRKNPDFAFTITSNKNYMDFYDTYPSSCIGENFMTQWQMYAETPLEKGVRDQLYPAMREKLTGLSQVEAVQQILWWTQGYDDEEMKNAYPEYFQYAFDEDIWGTDRAFFGEETLFYPWCDCEDRAILFSHLVRDIVGLDVALVYYPGHLAAAVAFTEPVRGDAYETSDGRRFTVCDPTILGGDVGETMTLVKEKPATLMVLRR